MTSLLAQIGFDPEIRGALVVGVGAIVLFGSIWMIMATNQGPVSYTHLTLPTILLV